MTKPLNFAPQKEMSRTLNLISQEQAEFVTFRFIDTPGQWRDISYHVSQVDDDFLKAGFMFDGSSLPGWRAIENSDMMLLPDDETACIDVFREAKTVLVICSVLDPETREYYSRDPRSTALRAEEYLKKTGIADEARFGPEPEFFIFENVQFMNHPEESFFKITSDESPNGSMYTSHEMSTGHTPLGKQAYCAVAPRDLYVDMRTKMMQAMNNMGVIIEKHHHEVAHSQHELGIRYASCVKAADWVCIYKQVVKEVAHSYGKTATFMPKPLSDDNGSGMHVHQSLFKNGENIFAGDDYAGLSEEALYYLGGILKHGKALNAFTNPTMNSYRRLVPGFEAPTLAVYSAKNRSAACRIPFTVGAKAKRMEARFPDPSANPYLAFAAMLMAGLDGIKNKIHPGNHFESNLYDLSKEEVAKLPSLATSLDEALTALDKDRAFLLEGDVFTSEQIDAYIDLKREEIHAFNKIPTPTDFKLYYSC